MSLECTMAEVPCLVIRDGVCLRSEVDSNKPAGYTNKEVSGSGVSEPEPLHEMCMAVCPMCDERDDEDQPGFCCLVRGHGARHECYHCGYIDGESCRYSRSWQEVPDGTAERGASRPVGGRGYEPQPMLALGGPRPILALEGPPPVLALPAPPPPSPAPTVPDQEPGQEPDLAARRAREGYEPHRGQSQSVSSWIHPPDVQESGGDWVGATSCTEAYERGT